MPITRLINRTLSLLVAAGWLVGAVAAEGLALGTCVRLLLFLSISLSCIWFPDVVGGIGGYVGPGAYVSAESPPGCVVAAGWFFLVGLPLAELIIGG